MIARPTVAEERWLLLADRYPGLRAAADLHDRGGGWKTTTWWARILGFLLGLFATSLLAGVLWLLPARWLVGGALLMLAAEWLVAQRRVYRSGVEEAVYLCGAVCVVVQVLDWSTGNNAAAACALIATAVLLVGWRLLNPVFTTLALAGYSLAIALAGNPGFGSRWDTHLAAIFCAALALLGLSAGARLWRRPAHDRMGDGLVIVMPWLAYGWLMAHDWGRRANYLALAVALGFCVIWCIVGARRRSHPPLIGALGCLVCVAWSLHELLPWPVHWQLILAGAVLLLLAVLLERSLRGRTAGITSSALQEPAGIDILQFAGAAQLAPAPAAAPPEPVQGQGGNFAGGGASGRF